MAQQDFQQEYRVFYFLVILCQALLIFPGLAYVFSLWLTRGHGRGRNAIWIFGAFPLFVAIFIAVAYVANLVVEHFDPYSRISDGWLFFLVIGICVLFTFRILRSFARYHPGGEAKEWLSVRSTVPKEQRQRELKAIQTALWFPAVSVAIVFLSFPEAWGISTHIFNPRAGTLLSYSVPIPKTWAIQYRFRARADGSSNTAGVVLRGPVREPLSYLHRDMSISTWNVGTHPYQEQLEGAPPRNETVLGRRSITICSETIRCVEYLARWVPEGQRGARCYGRKFDAGFVGDPQYLETFYHMLEHTQCSK